MLELILSITETIGGLLSKPIFFITFIGILSFMFINQTREGSFESDKEISELLGTLTGMLLFTFFYDALFHFFFL